MEALTMYLDNLFSTLPDTPEVRQARADLLDSMESRYDELKGQGKSENEAVGAVISEFGNIDELKAIFEAPAGDTAREEKADEKKEAPVGGDAGEAGPAVDAATAEAYLDAARHTDFLNAIGVVLCIVSPIPIILVAGFFPKNDSAAIIGLVPLFIFVAAAVALFITASRQLEDFQFLKDSFRLTPDTMEFIQSRQAEESGTWTMGLTIGICLCVLSPLAVIVPAAWKSDLLELIGVAMLLLIVAVGCFLIILFGSQKSHIERLRSNGIGFEGDYTWQTPSEPGKRGHRRSLYWSVVTLIYLTASFLFGQWDKSWCIWPLAAILHSIIRRSTGRPHHLH